MTDPEPAISVVIPTLNEGRGSGLERALDSSRVAAVERLVVDGGSIDDTRARALARGADRVIDCEPGRGRQLNAGLAAARARVVLFLHADTELEPGWAEAVRRALLEPDVVGGAFRLRFESPRRLYRLLEWGVRLRFRVGGLPYGDQALFCRTDWLRASGGVPETPIFEDLDVAARMRRAGRVVLLPLAVRTSPRRYETHGVARVILRNQRALLAWALDRDRETVARWYRGRS